MKASTILTPAIAALSLFVLAACDSEEPATKPTPVRPVLSMVVADVEAIRLSTYPGRAKAVHEVNVGFEVPGKMLSRPVKVGSKVKAGDVLGILDTAPYKARVRALEGQRASLLANLKNARLELKRREDLAQKGFVAQARVDDQVAVVNSTLANIEATEGSLDEARLNLRYTSLVAPFDGTVSETFIDNFQNVNARQPVVRLLDTSKIEMEIAVPENLIGLEPYVESVEVVFSSLKDVTIPAKIARIGNEASTTTRTYPVTLIMEQPKAGTIQPGMAGQATAKIRLPEDWQKTGIKVPASAVFSPDANKPSETFVWIIESQPMKVVTKRVTIKSFTERGLLVTGLNAGDRIVTAGVNTLTDGQVVRLLKDVE